MFARPSRTDGIAAWLFVASDDGRFDSPIPTLPAHQVDVYLPSRLISARCGGMDSSSCGGRCSAAHPARRRKYGRLVSEESVEVVADGYEAM
jgi:hypothetical protein